MINILLIYFYLFNQYFDTCDEIFYAGHVAFLLKSYIVSPSSTKCLSAGTYTADAAKEGLTTQQVGKALGLSLGRQVMMLLIAILLL